MYRRTLVASPKLCNAPLVELYLRDCTAPRVRGLGRGAWRDNVFVERLWRSVRYEDVCLRAYGSVSQSGLQATCLITIRAPTNINTRSFERVTLLKRAQYTAISVWNRVLSASASPCTACGPAPVSDAIVQDVDETLSICQPASLQSLENEHNNLTHNAGAELRRPRGDGDDIE